MDLKHGWFRRSAATVIAAVIAFSSPLAANAREWNDQSQQTAVSATVETYMTEESAMNEFEGDEAFEEDTSAEVQFESAPVSNAQLEQYLAPYRARFNNGERASLQIIGYFLSIKQDRAAGIVAKGIADGYLSLDEAGSAANIDNVIKSLDVISQCNVLRKEEGLSQLMADPEMMAIAIVQTSCSRGEVFHSKLYDVSENLAWGYQPSSPLYSGRNPFDAWYVNEKQIHEAGGNGIEIAHYLHIVDPGYAKTGAAIVTANGAMYNIAIGQTFSYEPSSMLFLPEEMRCALEIFQDTGQGLTPEQIVTPEESGNQNTMFRMYNPNSGEHFYTNNSLERNQLVRCGWKYEGCGWIAPSKSKTPVYRLYNPNAGDHHYTTSKGERDSLVKAGWKDEGIGWYSADDKSVPVYRQYNPNAKAGSHNFTPDEKEHNALGKYGWKLEGTAWYASALGQ